MPNSSAAVVLFNKGGGSAKISFGFGELEWQGKAALASAHDCHVRSVWDDGKEVGVFSDTFSADVNGSAVFFATISDCAT
eukprot:COSAG02_NODE_605_length_19635_cov_7.106982_4_plen_80_part_00